MGEWMALPQGKLENQKWRFLDVETGKAGKNHSRKKGADPESIESECGVYSGLNIREMGSRVYVDLMRTRLGKGKESLGEKRGGKREEIAPRG